MFVITADTEAQMSIFTSRDDKHVLAWFVMLCVLMQQGSLLVLKVCLA